jgi:predicted GIY-YIG superfamily endonuclease
MASPMPWVLHPLPHGFGSLRAVQVRSWRAVSRSNVLSEREARVEGLHACEADGTMASSSGWFGSTCCAVPTARSTLVRLPICSHAKKLTTKDKAHLHGSRRPVRVVYSEPCESIESAVTRERQLKRWSKEKKLALINGDLKKLKQLSRSHHRRRTTKVRGPGQDRD